MPAQNPASPEQARQTAEARLALEASMNNIGASLDNTLKSRAANLHSNFAALSKQQDALVKETANLKKENDKLGKVANDMSKQLKELGNVQNWAEMLERDFMVVEETLRRVREGSTESEGSWSGSSWSGSEDGDVSSKDKKDAQDGDHDVEMGGMDAVATSDMANDNKGKGLADGVEQPSETATTHAAITSDPKSMTPTTRP